MIYEMHFAEHFALMGKNLAQKIPHQTRTYMII